MKSFTLRTDTFTLNFNLIISGTLLCAVVGIVEGRRVTGHFRDPKTLATERKNIDKALEVLRVRRSMGQRYVEEVLVIFSVGSYW